MNDTNRATVMIEARKAKGLTQWHLARAVRCSESQIAKIETGRAQGDQWLKDAIAKELGITPHQVGVYTPRK